MDRAAGRSPRRRRAFLAAALLALAATMARAEPGVAESAQGLLVPVGPLVGGLAAAPLPVPAPFPGTPARPSPPAGYLKFIYPSAVAVYGLDAYVADSGLAALLRIDLTTQTVVRLASLPQLPGVVLRTGPDGTLYLLRPDRSEVQRLSRDGRTLVSFADVTNLLQPRDLAIEPTLGRIWITDAAGDIFEFHPSGRLFEPLARRDPARAEPAGDAFGLLAAGAGRVVAYDGRCHCLADLDREGVPQQRTAEGSLLGPAALAIDGHQRIWAIDRADRQLKVFAQGRLSARLTPAALGLLDFTALAIAQQRLYIADGPGGRIGVFDLLPPGKGAP